MEIMIIVAILVIVVVLVNVLLLLMLLVVFKLMKRMFLNKIVWMFPRKIFM